MGLAESKADLAQKARERGAIVRSRATQYVRDLAMKAATRERNHPETPPAATENILEWIDNSGMHAGHYQFLSDPAKAIALDVVEFERALSKAFDKYPKWLFTVVYGWDSAGRNVPLQISARKK
jgi:hypothetical protein